MFYNFYNFSYFVKSMHLHAYVCIVSFNHFHIVPSKHCAYIIDCGMLYGKLYGGLIKHKAPTDTVFLNLHNHMPIWNGFVSHSNKSHVRKVFNNGICSDALQNVPHY